jgi:multicomponent Na+:H+ antiporter subunit E
MRRIPLWTQVRYRYRRVRFWLLAGATLWWVMTEGDYASWITGVPAVLVAAVAVLVLTPSRPAEMRLRGVVAFVPYFVWRSLAGGVDVAMRALRTDRPVSPSLATYRTRLPAHGPARVVFVSVIGLLPGTLAADLRADAVSVHLLSGTLDAAGLERLEVHVARIFGHSLGENTT